MSAGFRLGGALHFCVRFCDSAVKSSWPKTVVEIGHPVRYNNNCTKKQSTRGFAPKLDLWQASPTPM
jgi:hypothetical protein